MVETETRNLSHVASFSHISQEMAEYRPQARTGGPLPVCVKFYRNTGTLIHLRVVYNRFHALTALWSCCDQDCRPKSKIFTVWPFTEDDGQPLFQGEEPRAELRPLWLRFSFQYSCPNSRRGKGIDTVMS